MHIAVIIDGILLLVLLLFLFSGIHRGLFLSLAGLLVLIVSLAGAGFAANHFSGPVTEALRPTVEEWIVKRVDGALVEQTMPEAPTVGQTEETPRLPQDLGIPEDLSVAEQARRILEALGLGERVREGLYEQVEETVRDTSVSVLSAVADNLLRSVVHTVLFLLSFAALTLVLHLVVRLLDLVLKLPGLHLLNALGGALVGLVQGGLVLFLAFWVLDRFGLRMTQETIGDTWLLQFFVTNGPLGFLSSL